MKKREEEQEIIEDITSSDYHYGFTSDIETEYFPKGINEDIIRKISQYKEEPQWLLQFRLDAFKKWQTMTEPHWGHLSFPPIDYQDIIYFAVPKKAKKLVT